ncbi:hypothetical protein AB4Z01_18660 [Inquilinus sp. YAF38]|uniref:hypothetical protein n=1 Tax=Inquilinus sp. YAF38 TaxID=3233084 RepID=UPI003F936D5F
MLRSMDKAQTDRMSEAPATPQEERAARHLRMLARAAEIQMEIMEATRTEAVEAPQPGADYCKRIAVVAKSLRQTVLLEDKLSRPREERPKAEVGRGDRARSRMRVTLAMGAAAIDGVEGEEQDEANRRFDEMTERLERPELVELIETCPTSVAVDRLCRMFGLPLEVDRWIEMGDAALAEIATWPSDGVHPPADPPWSRPAGSRRSKPPDTG